MLVLDLVEWVEPTGVRHTAKQVVLLPPPMTESGLLCLVLPLVERDL